MTAKKNNGFKSAGKSHSDETSTISQVSQKKRGQHKMVGRASAESKVAFFASVTPNLEHLGKDQDIIFDHAVTNIGNGFLPHNGTFVAPVSGTYVLSVTLLHIAATNTWGHLVVNGSVVAKFYFNNGQSSQTVIVYLRQGEDVSVQNTATDRKIDGDRYSTFSGFLLYEDFSVNIVG
ncbi:complement C1q tumor necrosis factor-related protein 3-like [Ruditapes philippinarum]|uniref:complement C1q tumor necrosis factor-related protein 3-like n=1 Tax=Ruditapes philippinarum TaxID=129788 RepID=UPI00295AF10B|nr:complement C1q tumor necrosis factor-related protein 3-like [Ruditapes philippinarum]